MALVPGQVRWICAVGPPSTSSSPPGLVDAVREAWCSGAERIYELAGERA